MGILQGILGKISLQDTAGFRGWCTWPALLILEHPVEGACSCSTSHVASLP